MAKLHQARYRTPNKGTSTQLYEICRTTDSNDMLVLSFTVASRYYSCCTDGREPVPEIMGTSSYLSRYKYKSESESLYGWQSVSQYVLVSSPVCERLTRYCFLFKSLGLEFVVLSLWGALPEERPGLSFVSHSLVICLCVHLLFTFLSFTHLPYTYIHYTIHITYTMPLLVPVRYSRLCPTTH
jgi:hypothetical protein